MLTNQTLQYIDMPKVVSIVYNKEEKRVSNTLYATCKMFLESHAPGIQTLTNESVRPLFHNCGYSFKCKQTRVQYISSETPEERDTE